MTNPLEPGQGGLAAPQPTPANPPQPSAGNALAPQGGAGTAPGGSPMMSHFGDAQAAAAAQFQKIKEAQARARATRKELDWLLSLGDTVTQDDAVKAGSGLVAGGIPAVQVAGILAQMPDGGPALQAWIQHMDAEAQKAEAKVAGAMQGARYHLGLIALKTLIAHSTEGHEQRRLLAAATPQGRA